MIGIILACSAAFGMELRTYRQFKDVAMREKGDVRQSDNKANLFEYTYSVNLKNNIITRTKIRRLDRATAEADSTVYIITDKRHILGSEAGNGGDVFIAVRKNGSEMLELGRRFAFTTRISPFSQVITGVYKRMYDWDENRENRCKKHR